MTLENDVIAQRRDEYNDTVHLFVDETTTYDWVNEESVQTRRALCRDGVTMKRDADQHTVTAAILEEDYLISDGDVIGEICGNCQQVLESRV